MKDHIYPEEQKENAWKKALDEWKEMCARKFKEVDYCTCDEVCPHCGKPYKPTVTLRDGIYRKGTY